jgi:heme/copper-type cytochrome/quinol oxidase subunit 2
VYTLIRFGRRPADPEVEPAQVYGSTYIELAWTIVPLLIVVVLSLVTARYIWGIERRAQPPDALEITVVGHQWWWGIRWPRRQDGGAVVFGEFFVGAVQARLVAAGQDDAALELVAHDGGRDAAEGGKGSSVAGNPAGPAGCGSPRHRCKDGQPKSTATVGATDPV